MTDSDIKVGNQTQRNWVTPLYPSFFKQFVAYLINEPSVTSGVSSYWDVFAIWISHMFNSSCWFINCSWLCPLWVNCLCQLDPALLSDISAVCTSLKRAIGWFWAVKKTEHHLMSSILLHYSHGHIWCWSMDICWYDMVLIQEFNLEYQKRSNHPLTPLVQGPLRDNGNSCGPLCC